MPLPTNSTKILNSLKHLVPSDYFHGIQSRNLCIADNIVVFLRRNGDILNRSNFESRPHHRHVLILNFGTAGSVSADGSIYRLKPGEAFLITPYQFHFYIDIEATEINWLFITFETPNPTAFSQLENSPVPLSEELANTALSIAEGFNNRDSLNQNDFNQLTLSTTSLLTKLRQNAQAVNSELIRPIAPATPGYELVRRVNSQLNELLAEGIGIQKLGENLGLSESHLRKRFKEIAGVSLGSYLVHYKLNRAVKLLAHSESSLTDISIQCGYDSLAAFSRSFKSNLGITPSEFRKQGF